MTAVAVVYSVYLTVRGNKVNLAMIKLSTAAGSLLNTPHRRAWPVTGWRPVQGIYS